MDLEHKIIEYLAGNDFKLGLVTRQQRDKLQIEDVNRRQDSIREKQVVLIHGHHAGGDFATAAAALAERIQSAAADIDTELLWSTVGEAGKELEIAELALEYFGEKSPLQQSAIVHAVMTDTAHFKRKGLAFVARTAADVDAQQNKGAREAERAAVRERALVWIRTVVSGDAEPGSVEIPDDLADFMGLVEAYMYQDHKNEAARLLENCGSRLLPREIGLDLLEKTGRLGPDDDPFLLVNGVQFGFSEAVQAYAQALPPFVADPTRGDYRDEFTFTIDDAETREVDDALSVRRDGESLIVGIHIADPATFVLNGDPIDRTAADRPLTLYLPTSTVTMVPEHLGCDISSLNVGVVRPTLSFHVTFGPGPDFAIIDSRFGRGQIRVSRRLDYDETDRLLANTESDSPEASFCHDLRALLGAADKLQADRLAGGALRIVRPEIKVRVHDHQVSVKVLDTQTPSHNLVSEMMILANRLAAEFALRNSVPIIYRTQEGPASPIPPMEVYNPHVFDQAVRQLKRSRLSTQPERHFGLGLDVYTQISSPIRRYSDLVMQRQIAAHLAGAELPYSDTEIVEVLATADGVEQQNRRLERESTRYWILEFLRREHVGGRFDGTVIDDGKGGKLVELHPWTARGRYPGAAKLKAGDAVNVAIASVDPKRGFLTLKD